MRRPQFTIAFVAASIAVVSVAAAPRPVAVNGSLRGRVDIGNVVLPAEPRPGVSELGVDLAYRAGDRRRAVVYFETAPQPAFEEGGEMHATMKQENQTFVPHLLAIRVGTTVEFPNADPFFHNVFSLSHPKRFDLGRYAKGHSKSVLFDQPGIVRVFCDIHSHMNAFILVFAHRFFAVTDDEGRYRIDRVPPGTYTVVAWYEGIREQSRAVTVTGDGRAVEADFTLR